MEAVQKLRASEDLKVKDYAERRSNKSVNIVMIVLAVLPLAAFIISFTVGRYPIPVNEVFDIFLKNVFGVSASIPQTVETVMFNVRMPRIFAALFVGGALAISGASYQGLFKNPMVSPDILGASAGAGFGAAVGILFSFGIVGIQVSAFAFGIGAVVMTFIISSAISKGNNTTLVLVLTGMVVSTLFSAFISMTKYVADPDSKLPAITFWLMGGLSSIRSMDVKVIMVPMLLGAVPLMLIRWKLNVLSFGDEESKSLGLDTKKLRMVVIACSTLLTASAVSICGMVGWIGLVIPHLARMLVGPNYKSLLPASLFLGSTFLLVVDDIARSLFAIEIPLGILTSMLGAPFFLYLLLKGKRGWV